MALWMVPVVVVAVGLALARPLREMRRKVERDEKQRTREYEASRKSRLRAVKRNEALLRKMAKERDARKRDKARRDAERASRDLLLDELSAIQKRALKRIKSIKSLLKSGESVRGENAVAWVEARKAKSLPPQDIQRLHENFRELEVQLSRREYEKERLFELVNRCGALKRELTSRSVYFKDAERFEELLPDEEAYRRVPEELPAMYGFAEGKWRNNSRGRYFLLPHGITGRVSESDPGTKGLRTDQAREVFVHRVDYRKVEAVVSVGAATLLRAVGNQQDAVFSGQIERIEPAGARVLVHGVRCFLPRRFLHPSQEAGDSLTVRFEQIDHFLKSPVVVTAQAGRAKTAPALKNATVA